MPDPADGEARRRLDDLRRGAAPAEVLAFYDSLPTVPVDGLVGRWRGSEVPTGSPLDGLLAAYGWWGKEILDAETVHPLLVEGRGTPYAVNPAVVPLRLVRSGTRLLRLPVVRFAGTAARPLARTRRPTARIRQVTHRGVTTAALVYDALPIIDSFRRVADDVVLGLMDMRGLHDPFAFALTREPAG